jgi:hypothetical protein
MWQWKNKRYDGGWSGNDERKAHAKARAEFLASLNKKARR